MKVCICHGFKINQKIISGNSPLDLDADADRSLPVRRQAQQAQLPRQYMHNKENAVTMRLSAH